MAAPRLATLTLPELQRAFDRQDSLRTAVYADAASLPPAAKCADATAIIRDVQKIVHCDGQNWYDAAGNLII